MTGLITINDINNIGNRLQNYACFVLLNRFDKTINIVRKYGCEYKRFPDRKHYYLAKIYHSFLNLLSCVFHPHVAFYKNARRKNFKNFNSYITSGEFLKYNTDYKRIESSYERFFVGSDQVWNPSIPGNGMYINMLGFVHANAKKHSIAPSISQDNLSVGQKQIFANYLSTFSSISCREVQGAKLLEGILHRKVTTLLDPTFMLSSNEWDLVAKKPSFRVNDKFILVYFLGGINEKYKQIISYYSNYLGLPVVDILDQNSIYFTCGPSEFLWLVKNSSLILTDSFHGVAFSCIYNKKFKLLERTGGGDMNSRLTSIKKMLLINDDSFISSENFRETTLTSCFSKECLNIQKEVFMKYLKDAFAK